MRPFKLLLFLWLYAGWFVCVYSVTYDFVEWTPLVPLLGLALLLKTERPSRALLAGALALILAGIAFDTVSYNMGGLRFVPEFVKPWLPLWLVSIWLLFIPGILVLRNIFGTRYWIAGLMGAVVGPLSYHSGEAFGVLYFTHNVVIAIYAVLWAGFMAGGIYVLNQIDLRSANKRS